MRRGGALWRRMLRESAERGRSPPGGETSFGPGSAPFGARAYSHRVAIGMVGLLILCERASGRSRAAERWLSDLRTKAAFARVHPHAALRAFGAKPLSCADAPDLYAILLDVCARAGMKRLPELFLLPASGMNAYALGSPDDACISVTEGLLSGLSRGEVAGILAHEVAHILHNDTGSMHWAGALQAEIAEFAAQEMAALRTRRDRSAQAGSLALLLAAAPAVASLLVLALSRLREFAADAMALELIDDPQALVAALCKLEYFHSGRSPLHAHLQEDARSASGRSHPGTWERIANLA